MRRVLGVFMVVFFGFAILSGLKQVFAASPYSAWLYNTSFTVTNPSESALVNFQVPFFIDTASLISDGKMKSDCSDLRVADANGNALNYWIATAPSSNICNQSRTKVWVKMNSIPSTGTTLSVYYGNSSASSESNGDSVFNIFADFSIGTSLPNNWGKLDISYQNNTLNTGSTGAYSIGGSLSITNSNGEDVWYDDYQATHVYYNTKVTGSFIAEALVNSQTFSSEWAKTGISVQNSFTPSITNGQAFIIVTPGQGAHFQYENEADCNSEMCAIDIAPGANLSNGDTYYNFPALLSLRKNNDNQVSGYFTYDNFTSWNSPGSGTPMGISDDQYLSLFVTPHSTSATSTATYSYFYVRQYSSEDPIVVASHDINSCEELANISTNYPNGSGDIYNLTKDIDCSGITFLPINFTDGFSGTFNGHNHTINNLTIDRGEESQVGLFKYLVNEAKILDLTITNAVVTGSMNVGCFAGYSANSSKTIYFDNIHCSGSVTGGYDTGGLIGLAAFSNIKNSSFAGTINSSNSNAGGLIGEVNNEGPSDIILTNSYFDGTVSGNDFAGGLVGYLSCNTSSPTCSISNSYSSGTIAASGSYSGGLVGYGYLLNLSQSYSNIDVNSTGQYVGGLVGYLSTSNISDCYSTSNVNSSGNNIGGLVGYDQSYPPVSIYRSYSSGTITSTGNNIGGLVGSLDYDDIVDSFTVSQLSSGEYLSLVGNNNSGSISNSIDTTSQNVSYFQNNIANAPLSSWNFSTIWKTTSAYPIFQWQTIDNNLTQSSAGPASTPSGYSASVCTDIKPLLVPDLFQINTANKSAKLFFTPSNTDQYYISFSTKPDAEMYGEQVTLLKEGVQSHTIYLLKPNTTYYIKVRGQNGCMPGEWSNVMKFTTNNSVYYKNSFSKSFTKKTVVSNSPQITPTVTPSKIAPSPTPQTTESPKVSPANQSSSVPSKHCLLWWCW